MYPRVASSVRALSTLSLLFLSAISPAAASPKPQVLTNNAPFSGAVYLYYPGGGGGGPPISGNANQCPGNAPVSCSGSGLTNW